MDILSQELMKILVPTMGTVLSLLVTWGLFELKRFIKTKTDNEAVNQAMVVLSDVIQSTVVSINQTATKAVRDDGKMDKAEALALKRKASTLVMSQVSTATKKVLEKNLADLSVYVDNRIESAVHYEKDRS